MDGGLLITCALVAKVVVGVAVQRARGGTVAANDQAAPRGQTQVFLVELFADVRQVFEILGAHGSTTPCWVECGVRCPSPYASRALHSLRAKRAVVCELVPSFG